MNYIEREVEGLRPDVALIWGGGLVNATDGATAAGSPDSCRVLASNDTAISVWSRRNNKWPWSCPGPFGTKMPLD